MTDAGLLVITAFISPFRSDRETARMLVPAGEFVEVYVRTPIEECERRDPKGLYAKARAGELTGFTGVDDPYEEPIEPDVLIQGDAVTAEDAAAQILGAL